MDNHSLSINYDAELSVLLLGNSGVGKTSLIRSLMGDANPLARTATIGVDRRSKLMRLDEKDKTVNFVMWDTSGVGTFKTVVHSYFRQADCYILVFDVTSPGSFQDVDGWLKAIEAKGIDENLCFLMANKIDEREPTKNGNISTRDASSFCAKMKRLHSTPFMVSAKTGEGVNEAFNQIAELLLDNMSSRSRNRQDTVTIGTVRSESDEEYTANHISTSTRDQKRNCAKAFCNVF